MLGLPAFIDQDRSESGTLSGDVDVDADTVLGEEVPCRECGRVREWGWWGNMYAARLSPGAFAQSIAGTSVSCVAATGYVEVIYRSLLLVVCMSA